MIQHLSIILFFPLSFADDQLLFVISLWRTGIHAPVNEGIALDRKYFPYGYGQLTELGINQTYNVGRFLRSRYIDEIPLLSPILNVHELYLQSTDTAACISSAQTVGQGMYNADGREIPLPLPVHTSPRYNDWLLAFDWRNCPSLSRFFHKTCASFPLISQIHSQSEYDKLILRCANATKEATFFVDEEDYEKMEYLITENAAGVPPVFWLSPSAIGEGKRIVNKMHRYQRGVGEFFNAIILRLSTGRLIDTIQREMLHKWKCIQKKRPQCNTIRNVKFRAFSTDESVIDSLLDILGIRNVCLGDSFSSPSYNSLILIELWQKDSLPSVKIFYRPDSFSSPIEVTSHVRQCRESPCPLHIFLSCCTQFTTINPQKDCNEY